MGVAVAAILTTETLRALRSAPHRTLVLVNPMVLTVGLARFAVVCRKNLGPMRPVVGVPQLLRVSPLFFHLVFPFTKVLPDTDVDNPTSSDLESAAAEAMGF